MNMEQRLSARKRRNVTLASVFIFAGVLYALISLVNHYLFKTYALDLGLYTHALYDYAHFRMADCSMFKDTPLSLLSDHFDLYLIILSPLVYVFGTYTLLIVQMVAVLLGGWGIYKLIGLYTDDDWLPVLATACFLFSFGIIHPIAFDYHSNVLSTMMLPWILYYIKRERMALATLFVVLFVIGKENMSLWLFFIAIGLMWDYRKNRKIVLYLGGYAVFSLLYFFIINMIVMPKLGGSGGGFYRYEYLGGNYVEIAQNLLTHPKLALKLLFTSTISPVELQAIEGGLNPLTAITIANPEYAGIKEEFYYCILATGLVFTLLKPNYLFMLLPLLGQKMLACQPNFWGISFHYSVEFISVIITASFIVFSKLKTKWLRTALSSALLLSVVLTTFYTIGVPKSLIVVDHLCVYQSRHYRQDRFDADYARQLMEMIPEDAYVCATSMFVPQLSLRDRIEELEDTKNTKAEYVLLTEHYFGFLRNGELMFGNRDDFETVATDGNVFLLRRKQP